MKLSQNLVAILTFKSHSDYPNNKTNPTANAATEIPIVT